VLGVLSDFVLISRNKDSVSLEALSFWKLTFQNENTAVGYGIADYVKINEFSVDLKCRYKWNKVLSEYFINSFP
jgi:hypothetical protein